MEFLVRKELISAEPKDQFNYIKQIWFDFYPRNKNTTQSSSGFEHVFLSEIKKGKIIGLHNWIYFADEEKSGNINYKGWLKQVDFKDVRSCAINRDYRLTQNLISESKAHKT